MESEEIQLAPETFRGSVEHVLPINQARFHGMPVLVQFEDVDAGGVVHHPNFLKYCERGRCALMSSNGVTYQSCLEQKVAFVVAEVLCKYHVSAVFGDELVVVTTSLGFRRSSVLALQTILRAPSSACEVVNGVHSLKEFFDRFRKQILFSAQIRLVCVNLSCGKPMPMNARLRTSLALPFEDCELQDWRYGKIKIDAGWNMFADPNEG